MRLADKTKTDAAGKNRQSSFVLHLISIIIVAVLLVTSTFAWVGLNENNKSNNINMNVDYDKFFVEQEYYQYNPRTSSVEKYDGLTGVKFNQYDLVFRIRNRYTPIVAAIKMTGTDLKDNGTITLSIQYDSSNPSCVVVDGKNQLADYFSSIMRVTAVVGSEYYEFNDPEVEDGDPDRLYKEIDEDYYEIVRSYTGNQNNNVAPSKVFTTPTTTNSGAVLSSAAKNDIELSIDYTEDDFVTISGVETLIVYLYLTYDEGYNNGQYDGLVGVYQKTSGSLGISATGDITDTSIIFKNDLVSIHVSHS